MGARIRRRLGALLAAAMAALMLSPQLGALAQLPEEMVLGAGTVTEIPVSSAVRVDAVSGADAAGDAEIETELDGEGGALRLTAGDSGEGELKFSLLGVLPIRTVKLSVQPQRTLVPGGQSVGVALRTGGVVVVGNSDLGKTPSPARLAGLKSGDVIQSVDGADVTGAAQLAASIAGGETAHLTVLRDGNVMECDVTPAQDERDGQFRLGAWVRDSTAGVGTLTYYDPETGDFGALGHAITDIDTGVLMPVGEGEIYNNRVVDIKPSREGAPGELTGDFLGETEALGTVTLNSEYGIFGKAETPLESALYPEGLPVANRRQIHTGAATLITTVEGTQPKEYECEIVRLSDRTQAEARAMVIRVTDPELLALTGGIVQGMSGSPLLQDGRIIGAVTHVMVNDPTMGYGIFIETMLEEARDAVNV
ncbi:MAG: SpoIVB peptidase [Clostridia bacterium]|nr:SpoIVB peptidase [Clostridia bacterium]